MSPLVTMMRRLWLLITREEHGGDDSEHETQYMDPENAYMYEFLVAQRVLSVQVTQAKQN